MAEMSELEIASKLGQAFDTIIMNKYGHLIAPPPIVTPIGVAHLDALLGGGIVSSGPVLFSSTPETGKSTISYQFSASFLSQYQNGIVLYVDIETSGNVASSQFRVSREDQFGLDTQRFKYKPVVVNMLEFFEMLEQLIDVKKQFEEKIKKEFYVAVIWDSIAATRSSKTDAAENPDKIIGVKARQLSFALDKYTPMLKFSKITFIGIDQVRADMKIEGPYAQQERSVGTFKNLKSATNVYALQHAVQQWIFFSKGQAINPADDLGIDGWFMNIHTEKNKLAPSKHGVTCVFDKFRGIDKFWSEFYFLFENIPSEDKIYKNKTNPHPLMMKKSGSQILLHVTNPNDSNIDYKSEKFYRKQAKNKYETDSEFRQWFDYAVQLSVDIRIKNGIFKYDMEKEQSPLQEAGLKSEATLADQLINELPIKTECVNEQSPTESFPLTNNIDDDTYQSVLG